MMLFILCAIALFASVSCESKEKRAMDAVKERLKNQGLRDIKLELFHPSKDNPGRAYVAVDVTHNFASGEGKFQHEYLGFILKQEGQQWAVENTAGYTKDASKAEDYIAGRK
jgi:hypothetical protein